MSESGAIPGGGGDMPDARPSNFEYGRAGASPSPAPTVERYKDLDDGDFEYNMRHKSRGIAVIINNDTFHPTTQMSDRSGSKVDRDNLERALGFVGFTDIIVQNNLTGRNMVDLMKKVAHTDFTNMDCLFVAILSHGDEKSVFATDRSLSYDTLFDSFKSDRASTLVGKPKIFLIQACRGEKLDEGRLLQTDAIPGKHEKHYAIAKESDFLLAYSTVPGYYSWRNCANGSWFVQAFCEVMLRDGRRLELVQLLTRVNRMVSYTFQSNASQLSMTNKKQSPCITSMLTKSVFFA